MPKSMRSGPSTGYRILGVYSVGTAVTVLESGTSWSRIQIGSRVGYMPASRPLAALSTYPSTPVICPAK